MLNDNYLNNVNYDEYYKNQLNSKNYHQGLKFQNGYGYFGRMLSRYAVPALKYIGKQAIKTGFNIIDDVSKGVKPKKALKRRLKDTGKLILTNLFDQMDQSGSGVRGKRKRVSRLNNKKIKPGIKKKIIKHKKRKRNQVKKISKNQVKRKLKLKHKRKNRSKLDFFS